MIYLYMHSSKEDIAVGMIAGVIVGTAVGLAAKTMCDGCRKSCTQRLMKDMKKNTARMFSHMK